MTVEVIRVDEREMAVYAERMGLGEAEATGCIFGARGADPALVFCVQGQPVVACGFVPTGLISGTVYAWMQDTPAVYRHQFAFKRTWYQVIREVRRHYPRIVGYCSGGERSIRWWKRLGARFEPGPGGRQAFMIGGYDE